jgi:Transposase DDE domain
MQKTVANIRKIINHFMSGVRNEPAYTISNIVSQLLVCSKISLYHLAISSSKETKLKSREQRIRRLISDFPICPINFAKSIFKMFNLTDVELAIDRTNWKFGTSHVNYFILSVIWKDIAIPIYWIMLDNNGGNSDSQQRINLINWFRSNFSNSKIINLYADREFPSNEFITWMLNSRINFIFRSKGKIKASDGNKTIYLSKLFNNLANQPNYTKIEAQIRRLFGCRLFVSARLNLKNEQIFLISNKYHKDPFVLYWHRWNIETMFSKFKITGFNLESTHIIQSKRLNSLFYLMTIAYTCCSKLGTIAHRIRPIKFKKLKDQHGKTILSPEFSYFKYGSYLLKNFLINNFLCDSAVVTRQLYQILNYPPDTNVPKRTRIYSIIAAF